MPNPRPRSTPLARCWPSPKTLRRTCLESQLSRSFRLQHQAVHQGARGRRAVSTRRVSCAVRARVPAQGGVIHGPVDSVSSNAAVAYGLSLFRLVRAGETDRSASPEPSLTGSWIIHGNPTAVGRILKSPEPSLTGSWIIPRDSVLKDWLEDWSNSESTRARLRLQAAIALETASKVHSDHAYLIAACVATYAPRYLPSYRVVYTDTSDGDRVTAKEREALRLAGVSLGLSDPMPDVILWDPPADRFWIIEAVTSDGEVDLQKLAAVRKWAERHSKILAGCTTAYATWKAAAVRQGKHKNLAPGTYLWILEDAGRQYRVQTTTDG